MRSVLITGASGLLGSRFKSWDGDQYQIITTHHKNPEGGISLDITDQNALKKQITNINPDVVVHCAALTDVDYCENHREEAYTLNVQGTKNLVNGCQEVDSKLIYVSTDFVFDGGKGGYLEEDIPHPVNYYAVTKLKGEEFVLESALNHIIARVSVLYGWHPRMNFVAWVINELKKGQNINIVDDHYNSPTLTDNAVAAIIKMIDKDKEGVYHTAGRERINRYEFARNIARVFDLDLNLISPIKIKNFVQSAERPKDSSLNVDKIQNDLGIKMLNTMEGLKLMKEAYDI